MATFLEDIAKRLKKKSNTFESWEDNVKWKPIYLEKGSFVNPAFHIPTSRDSRIKKEFSKVLTFIYEKARSVRKKGCCTIMPIPWKSPELNKIWSNVTRGKNLMIKIGLIQEYNGKYRFGAGRFNYGKTYAYFYENELKFIEYCEENNIKAFTIKNFNTLANTSTNIQIDSSKVRIGTGLRLERPKGVSKPVFENEISKLIYKKYAELEYIQKLADEINEKYYVDYPEFRILLRLKFHWSDSGKYLTKISLRATNSLCNLKEADKQEVLNRLNMKLASDVNCSVPRLNKSMNLGYWFTDGPGRYFETDMYELIFKEMYPNEIFNQEGRDAIKKLLLRTFFENSGGLLTRDIWNNIDQTGLDQNAVNKEVLALEQAVIKVAGPEIYGPKIYYVEACVYLRVLFELLKEGKNAWLIYDGFYSTGEMMDELFDAYVKGLIKIEFDEFYKSILKFGKI